MGREGDILKWEGDILKLMRGIGGGGGGHRTVVGWEGDILKLMRGMV